MKNWSIFLLLFMSLLNCGTPHFIAAQDNRRALPRPSGQFEVGFTHLQIQDLSRSDLNLKDVNRTLGLTVWYPTKDLNPGESSYFPDLKLLEEMLDKGYNRQDTLALRNMRLYKLRAEKDAAPFTEKKFPLLFFSHGLGVSRFNYATIAQEITSKGHVVVTIDHPYGGFLRTLDGRVRTNRDDQELVSGETDLVLEKRMIDWQTDIEFVLDQIFDSNSEIHEIVYGLIEEDKIAALGHSLGGNVAINIAEYHPRIKAAVNLDGGTFSLTKQPPSIPTLTLRSEPDYSEEEILSRGITLEEWKEKGLEIDNTFSEVFQGADSSYELKIKGAGHMSFSDAPFVLPDMITRFGGKIVPAEKAFMVVGQSIGIFLDSVFNEKVPDFSRVIENCGECEFKKYPEQY